MATLQQMSHYLRASGQPDPFEVLTVNGFDGAAVFRSGRVQLTSLRYGPLDLAPDARLAGGHASKMADLALRCALEGIPLDPGLRWLICWLQNFGGGVEVSLQNKVTREELIIGVHRCRSMDELMAEIAIATELLIEPPDIVQQVFGDLFLDH